MIIDLKTVTSAPRKFNFHLEPNWWRGHAKAEPMQGLHGPLAVQVSIYKAGDKYVLEGRISGGLRVLCDRCLEPYRQELKSEFRLFLVLSPDKPLQSDIELVEEDMAVDFITPDELDLDSIVREQIYLSLPIKSLCREDCAGICPTCGANRNLESCQCQPDRGYPFFSKLRNFRIGGE